MMHQSRYMPRIICNIFLLAVLIGCEKKDSSEMVWQYVRSPLSGRCYEVAQSTYVGDEKTIRLFAMNEVPCRELERNPKGVK